MSVPSRVLCGTDFQQTGGAATDLAARVAQALSAELVLIHAADVAELTDHADNPAFSTIAQRTMQKRVAQRVEEAKKKLEGQREELAKAGLKVSVDLRHGRPSAALADAAEATPGVLVVGPHDPSRSSLFGTTASRVIHQTGQPVLVATGDVTQSWQGTTFVVGVDYSDHSLAAVKVAQTWAKALGGKVVLFYASTPFPKSSALADEQAAVENEIAAATEAELKSWCETHRLDHLPRVIRPGSPETELMQAAKEHQPSVLVLGTRGHSRLGEIFLGSTTERLAASAPVPILVVEANQA